MGTTLILLPKSAGHVPPTDDLSLAINKAEEEMEERGNFGEWRILGPSILRFKSLDRDRYISFKIEKVAESDPVADLALSGDIMHDVQPKILKVLWRLEKYQEKIEILDIW